MFFTSNAYACGWHGQLCNDNGLVFTSMFWHSVDSAFSSSVFVFPVLLFISNFKVQAFLFCRILASGRPGLPFPAPGLSEKTKGTKLIVPLFFPVASIAYAESVVPVFFITTDVSAIWQLHIFMTDASPYAVKSSAAKVIDNKTIRKEERNYSFYYV